MISLFSYDSAWFLYTALINKVIIRNTDLYKTYWENVMKNLQLNKTILTLALGVSIMATTATTNASYNNSSYGDEQGHYEYSSNDKIDYAKVVHVDPITKNIKVSTPVERCWNKQVRNEYPRHKKHSHKNEIFGALIGAAVGNQVGKRSSGRNGRDIATAVGAVVGGVIGNDIGKHKRQHRHQNNHSSYRTVKSCEVEQQVSYEEQVVAYNVRYKYRGQLYTTRMNQHPGNRIQVRVSVTPVDYS